MTQHQKIVQYCRTHDGITVREAGMDLGVYCLHKRISELKEQGYVFDEPWEEREGKRWVRHRLIGEPVKMWTGILRQAPEPMPTVQMELVS